MKNKIKKLSVLVLSLLLIISLSSCQNTKDPKAKNPTNTPKQKTKMKITALKGPTGMGLVELMKKNDEGTASLDYEFTVLGSPDDLIGKVISKEIDVAAVPTNMALVLYNKTKHELKLAAVNTMGVLYVLENGNSINSIEDLKDRTVGTSGKGASPDYIFRYILKQNNINAEEDLMLDFSLQHSELATAVVAGDVKVALLPQPFVTTVLMKNKDVRIALDITKEWEKATDNKSKLAMGCIIVQKDYVEKNKEAFNMFLEEYKSSIDFVNNNKEEAGALIEKYQILPSAKIAKEAIPYSNIVYIDAMDAKPFLQDLYSILFDFDPKAVGGNLADDEFYYKK